MSASFSFPEKGSFCHQALEFTKQQRERDCQCEIAKLFKCACACSGDSPTKVFTDHVPNVRRTIFRFSGRKQCEVSVK